MTNKLLEQMSQADRSRLDLKDVHLPARFRLEESGKQISHVYFFYTGMASILFKGRGDYQSEIALIGNEGCSGCSVILGIDRTPQATTMQIEGNAHRCTTAAVLELSEASPHARKILLTHIHLAIIQRDETALAASRGTLTQRLARWILMAQDRVQSDEIRLTHDLISLMLGVRRAGVTTAMGELSRAALISQQRGIITVDDREGLLNVAGPFYGGPQAEAERLFPAHDVDAAPAVS